MRNYEMRKKKKRKKNITETPVLSGHPADPREKSGNMGRKWSSIQLWDRLGETLRMCGESVTVSQCVGFTIAQFKQHFFS